MARFLIRDFALANSAYIGAVVHFFGVDAGEADEENLITLYEGLTGSGTLRNPQRLDGEGMNPAPIYADEECIARVSGLAIDDHDTGIIQQVGVDATYAGAVMTPSGADVVNPAYPYTIIWATEIRNPSGVWTVGDPTKLIVPAGATIGTLHGQIAWTGIAADAYVAATWYKNGVATPYRNVSGKAAVTNPPLQVHTPTLVLVPTDAWTLVADSSDATSNIDVSDTWAEMRLG
jgi:hypothetical protein